MLDGSDKLMYCLKTGRFKHHNNWALARFGVAFVELTRRKMMKHAARYSDTDLGRLRVAKAFFLEGR